jgi:hypothetical protein
MTFPSFFERSIGITHYIDRPSSRQTAQQPAHGVAIASEHLIWVWKFVPFVRIDSSHTNSSS